MSAKVRQINSAWWVVVHHQGKRTKKRFGKTAADKRRAGKVAEEINHRLALGLEAKSGGSTPVPFREAAREWLRLEVELPLERGHQGHLAPGTAARYRNDIEVHLIPYFGDQDARSIGAVKVQALYDHCVDSGRPRSARSIKMLLMVLGLVLSFAQQRDWVASNAVADWKARRPKGRGTSTRPVARERVLSWEGRERVLDAARGLYPRFYPLVLFLAETGCRLGEAAALRWVDVDVEAGWARICRSLSSGRNLGPTKTKRERIVALSTRLQGVLLTERPPVFPVGPEHLVFTGATGGFLSWKLFGQKAFPRIVREALGPGRRATPHDLRHTWASLHMARGTPLKWIQEQGGWSTAKLLLDTYGHFMPSESRGFENALSAALDGPIRPLSPAAAQENRAGSSQVMELKGDHKPRPLGAAEGPTMRRISSSPSIPGSLRSARTTSMPPPATTSSASLALPTAEVAQPIPFRARSTERRLSASSSTTRTCAERTAGSSLLIRQRG